MSVLVRHDGHLDRRPGQCPRCSRPVLVWRVDHREVLCDERIGRDGERYLWRHRCVPVEAAEPWGTYLP